MRVPTPYELARERSVWFALKADFGMLGFNLIVSILGGSLTMIAECIRGTLMMATEVFALLVMRRIHRGRLAQLEFGHGKLEQIANLSIAGGMLVGAIWICYGALSLAVGDREPASPAGLAAATLFASLNVYINTITWIAVLGQTPEGSPVIMEAQLRSRFVKLASSCVVFVLLTLSALVIDPVIALWCDILGSLFVAGFIVHNALGMIRGGLPDLLDECATEAMQRGINRALAAHFHVYEQIYRVRSRRSGGTVFIEIALGFDPGLPLAEVDRRLHDLRISLQREVAGADISLLVSAPS